MVAKECYDRLGTFDVNAWVSPDWEMWARIGAHYNIHHLEHTTAYVIHNQNNTHVSGIPINIFRKQQLYYINKILALLKKNESYYRKKAMDNLDITVWYLSIKYRLIGNRPMAKDYLKVVKETNARKLKRSYLVSKALIRMHLLKVLNRRHTLQYALSKVNKVL